MKVRDNKVLVNKGLYISIVDNPTWIKNTGHVPYTSYTCSADKAEAEINNNNGFAAGEEVQH